MDTPNVPSFKPELTDGNQKFAQLVAEGMRPIDAYRQAYPNAKHAYLSQDAQKLLRKPKIREMIEEIQQDVRARFVLLAPEAQERVLDLATNAEQEKVRLQANIEILDRAGLKPPERVELQHLGVFGSMDPEEIKNMIRDNLSKKEVEK
jgi:predicted RecB family endonuclease